MYTCMQERDGGREYKRMGVVERGGVGGENGEREKRKSKQKTNKKTHTKT